MDTKSETRALWKRCFDDHEAFIDLYFRLRYTDEINRTVRADGKLIAALQTIPYPLWWGGEAIPVSYISGACTHPDYRARGVMRRLLTDTHRQMYAEGVYLSTLIPAEPSLFGYYARSGYAACFACAFHRVHAPVAPTTACRVEASTSLRDVHYRYLDTQLRQRGNGILHTPEDAAVVMADLLLGGGQLLVAYREERIVGLAFAVPEEAQVCFKELLADDEEARQSLLHEAAYIYKVETVAYVAPAEPKNACLLGMARVIRAADVLAVYARLHPEQTLRLSLTDDDALPANQGFYTLQGGTCVREETPAFDAIYETYTPYALADLLLRDEHFYMSLMLN